MIRNRKARARYWSYVEFILVVQRSFIECGYKRTHMDDISLAAEIPKGTIYRYAKSKEALFWLALRWADSPYTARPHRSRPVPAPSMKRIQRDVLARLSAASAAPLLDAGPPARPLEQARSELRAALLETYMRFVENRTALRLIQRCADEHPSLRHLHLAPQKKPAVDLLTRFLEVHREYQRRPEVPSEIVARVIYATVALMAALRSWRPPEVMYRKPRWIRDSLLDILVEGTLGPPKPPPPPLDPEDELDGYDEEYARLQQEELERDAENFSLLKWLSRPYPDPLDPPPGWALEPEETDEDDE